MGDRKFICKWGFLDFQTVDFDFFTADKQYTDQDRFMIAKLAEGDKLDLSDDYQEHEIIRIK